MAPARSALPPRGTAVAVAVAVAVLGLGGCADDGEPRSDPTWTPTSVPESPSTSAAATPTRPELPDAAKEATPAGAKAFIEHYFALIRFAEVTGKVRPLIEVSGPNCDGCNDGMAAIREHYRSGGYITGGGYTVAFKKLEEIKVENDAAYGFGAELTTRSATQVIVDGKGESEEVEPDSRDWTVVVLWAVDHWRLDIMELA